MRKVLCFKENKENPKDPKMVIYEKDIENMSLIEILEDMIKFIQDNNVEDQFFGIKERIIVPDEYVNEYFAKNLKPPYKKQNKEDLVLNFKNQYRSDVEDDEYYDSYEAMKNQIYYLIDIIDPDTHRDNSIFSDDEKTEAVEYILNNYIDIFYSDIDEAVDMSQWTIAPYQDGNDEGSNMGCFMSDLKDLKIDYDNMPKVITELFKSQNYNIEDIFNEDKVKNSKFLKSFIEEVEENYSFTTFLVFLVEKNYEFMKEKTLKVFNEECGLFDPIYGSGSVIGIKLEKPFEFNLEESLIITEGRLSNYGYNISQTY